MGTKPRLGPALTVPRFLLLVGWSSQDKHGAEAEVTGSEHFAEATALMEEVGKHFVAEDGRGAAVGYDDDVTSSWLCSRCYAL